MGSLISGYGEIQAGKAHQRAGYAKAKDLRAAAGQKRAVGQHQAEEELRQSELVQSRILAVAGASGGGVTDATVLKILGDNAMEGSLAAATRRYNAQSAAKALETQADIVSDEGDAFATASRSRAYGGIISEGTSLAMMGA